MKLVRFSHLSKHRCGVLKDDFVYPFLSDEFPENPEFPAVNAGISLSNVKLVVPVTPSKIVCVGRNYAAHAAELGNSVPESPLIFLKAPSALIAHGAPIVVPAQSAQVEHEGELGVVISRECKALTDTDDPSNYILGFVCLNDVTARDIQKKEVQFTRAKSFDTFCPVGEYIETELDVSDVSVRTKVNGVVKQDGKTSQMVFSVAFLIRYISNQMTLLPGDLVATGTPSGVSRLEPGDVCEIEIDGIGTLRNPVTD